MVSLRVNHWVACGKGSGRVRLETLAWAQSEKRDGKARGGTSHDARSHACTSVFLGWYREGSTSHAFLVGI